jgi:hypothetical protein
MVARGIFWHAFGLRLPGREAQFSLHFTMVLSYFDNPALFDNTRTIAAGTLQCKSKFHAAWRWPDVEKY